MCLNREDIDFILKGHLKSKDYELISCKCSSTEDVSVGFLSAQDKICITYRIQGKEENLDLFIKKIPMSLYQKQSIISNGSFHREVELYNKLLNSFKEHFIGSSIPRCYLARSNDIVVLEDLSCKGFKNIDPYKPLDLMHCKKTLETLAKLHSASLITENNENKKIIDLLPIIKKEVFMCKENVTCKNIVTAGIRALKKVTEIYLGHYPTDLINKAFSYMENLYDVMKSSESYPNVITHSDLWVNNIMFKYDDSANVSEACVIDFQLATYKAPSYDVQLFLHVCTVRELRDKHYNELIKHYFNALGKHLSLSNLSLYSVMTWYDFENMLKETLPVVISLAPLFLHFVLMPVEMVKDVMSSDEKFKKYYEEYRTDHVLRAMEENEHYKQRLLQAMTEFINYFNSN